MAGAIDVKHLPVDPESVEGAVLVGPPLISVADSRIRGRLRLRRLAEPRFAHHAAVPDTGVVENELTEATEVAQRHGETTSALFVTHVVDHPFRVPFHAVR